MATKRQLQERLADLESAIEQVKSISDEAVDPDGEEEAEDE